MPSPPAKDDEDATDVALARAARDVEETRRRVVVSIGDLQHELADAVDWRQWVRRKPGLAIGLAFGLGLWLGRGERSSGLRATNQHGRRRT